jgi:hypothetical protein
VQEEDDEEHEVKVGDRGVEAGRQTPGQAENGNECFYISGDTKGDGGLCLTALTP